MFYVIALYDSSKGLYCVLIQLVRTITFPENHNQPQSITEHKSSTNTTVTCLELF